MQAVLVMFRNDGERRSFSISREMTVIGRRQDCDLMIPLGEISRKHCRIIKEADTLRLEDLGSSNGTFHNGKRVQEAVLHPGDTIQVGPVSFVIQIDGEPAEDEMQPLAAAGAGSAAAADNGAPTAHHDDELEEIPEPGRPARAAQGDDEDLEVLAEEGEDDLEVLEEEPLEEAEEEQQPKRRR
jgi:predicted component of type VI protein secretion system